MSLPPAQVCNPTDHDIAESKKAGQHTEENTWIDFHRNEQGQKCGHQAEDSTIEKKSFGIAADRDPFNREPEAAKIKTTKTCSSKKTK